MEYSPKSDRPSRTPPSEWFTGEVSLTPLIDAPSPARLRAVSVTFQPGARTNWHTHPLGQTIYITEGEGRAQKDGGPVITLHPGDVVFFAPGERHWHGAAPNSAMTHVAMQEADETGAHINWEAPVSDAEYTG
ncbi:MAG: cupin domain-containing protein [Pseudomonadota bacterium]